jgi:DNA-binding MarR family transcriptional regulator
MNGAREELLKSVIEKMGSVMRSMHAPNEFPFGESRVSWPQIRILFYLSHKQEGVSVKTLSEELSVTSGAVTQFIDALVEKKLVRRDEDTSDRRLLRIKLTDLANAKFGAFRKAYFTKVSRAFNSMSDEDIDSLMELLSRINI